MSIRKPIYLDSATRTRETARNTFCGEPFDWFNTMSFYNYGLVPLTFDYPINWEAEEVCDILWIKRLFDINDEGFDDDPDDLYRAILDCDNIDEINRSLQFSHYNHFSPYYVLIPDVTEVEWAKNFNDKRMPIIIFNLLRYVSEYHEREEGKRAILSHNIVTRYSLAEFVVFLNGIRRREAQMGQMGLYWSTSAMESFLSKRHPEVGYLGNTIYPGDVDILLCRRADYNPIAIIEVKKHGKKSAENPKIGSVANESISFYTGDQKKYESLELLKRRFGCKMFMLFYPTTETEESIVKLEEIVFPNEIPGHAPQAQRHWLLDLPQRNNYESLLKYQQFFCAILEDRL